VTADFRLLALPVERFERYFSMTEGELAKQRVRRMTVDACPGFPCRVSLQDAEPDETILALSFVHHDVETPYRASGPIFVREGAGSVAPEPNTVPVMFNHRRLSIRAYDRHAMMVAADTCSGHQLESRIRLLFEESRAAYLHVHNAGPGCFACAVAPA